jgi:hypothetical protein
MTRNTGVAATMKMKNIGRDFQIDIRTRRMYASFSGREYDRVKADMAVKCSVPGGMARLRICDAQNPYLGDGHRDMDKYSVY